MQHSQRLSDLYASRGESYLLCDRFEEALDDFQRAYDSGINVKNMAVSQSLVFRALFGQTIAYGNLGMSDMVDLVGETLMEMIRTAQCSDCYEHEILGATNFHSVLPIVLCSNNNVRIDGPEVISIEDCVDFIDNTVGYCRILIQKAPASSRELLKFIIEKLAAEARHCCRAGGLWKGCFQKLGNKYHQWNQKWQVFGIPPDPSWD